MHEKELDDLIQAELDGNIAPAERRSLEQYLGRSTEARILHEEMRALQQILDQRAQMEPPASLRERIREQVERHSKRSRVLTPHFGSAGDKGARLVRLALAAAAVLVLAVLVVPSLMTDVDPEQLQGTMAAPAGPESTSRSISVSGQGVAGTIFTTSNADGLTVRVALESPAPGHVITEFDTNQIRLISTSGSAAATEARSGRVSVQLSGDATQLSFARLTSDNISLRMIIRVEGAPETPVEIDFPALTNFSDPTL